MPPASFILLLNLAGSLIQCSHHFDLVKIADRRLARHIWRGLFDCLDFSHDDTLGRKPHQDHRPGDEVGFVGASLGSMTLPWLIGQLFESVGPQVTMLTILGDLLVAVRRFCRDDSLLEPTFDGASLRGADRSMKCAPLQVSSQAARCIIGPSRHLM